MIWGFDYTSAIGMVAAVLTTISFIPQAVRIHRTKHTRDLSLPMYLLFVVGVALWLVYGLLISSTPVILANFVTLLLCIDIIVMKCIYH